MEPWATPAMSALTIFINIAAVLLFLVADDRVELVLLVLDLDDHDVLLGVALGVDRDVAGRAGEVLRLGDGVPDALGSVGLGALEGVGQDARGVEAHGGHS